MTINLLNKAILLTRNGQLKEAELLYSKLLEEEPENHILLAAAGLFYVNIKDYKKATEYLEKSYSIKKTFGTVSALGISKYENNDYEDAIKILEESLEYGESPEIYNKLILSLFRNREYLKAIDYTYKMYEKFPLVPESTTNMVKALTQSGKLLEAEKICVEYLREHQDYAPLWFHLGYLKEILYCDNEAACECFNVALKLGEINAYYNIAVSYQKRAMFKEAEENYRKMLEYFPDDQDTKTSFGMCCLMQKKFKEGYDLFFEREKSPLDKKTTNPWMPSKNWEDEIVILGDQGYGDHIQFIRYIPFLKEKVNKINIVTRPALTKILKKNYPEINFITPEEILPEMQSIRITDLAYALNMDFNNIPYSSGYLNSDKKDIVSNKLKVGLCWEAGSAAIRTMLNRTINIKLLEDILNLENIQIYSFQVNDSQKGQDKYPHIINLAKDFTDFNDTAEAIKAMDLMITVDTSVAHLSGALGAKTFLLLPYTSDWRWFNQEKVTPWYDSIEIFKQREPISWEEPIKDILCKLKEYSS